MIQKPEVDKSRIGGYAFSSGATAMAQRAADDPRISAVALNAVPSSVEDLLHDESGRLADIVLPIKLATLRFIGLQEATRMSASRALSNFHQRPLMLIRGLKDTVVGPERVAQVFTRAGGVKELLSLPLSGHGEHPDSERRLLQNQLVRFFARSLSSPKVRMRTAELNPRSLEGFGSLQP